MLFLDWDSGLERADSYTLWSLNLFFLSLRLKAAKVLNLGNKLLGLEMSSICIPCLFLCLHSVNKSNYFSVHLAVGK